MTFLDFGLIDLLDILLVAFLMWYLYKLLKGTIAINIFVGIFLFLLAWLIVKALNMELMSSIMGQFIGVGSIALIILFQQEIRRFLNMLGSRYNLEKRFNFDRFFAQENKQGMMLKIYVRPILKACELMSENRTGGLIVITRKSELSRVVQSGELINAVISAPLIRSIFFKNSPLHDGALVISENKIKAAGCVLPLSQNLDFPSHLGLRHRAGVGITQDTDACCIIVSEETGHISLAIGGALKNNITLEELEKILEVI